MMPNDDECVSKATTVVLRTGERRLIDFNARARALARVMWCEEVQVRESCLG